MEIARLPDSDRYIIGEVLYRNSLKHTIETILYNLFKVSFIIYLT